LRRHWGMSQRELAAKLRLSQGDISNLENGRRHVSLRMARRYAYYFGVDPKHLVGVAIPSATRPRRA